MEQTLHLRIKGDENLIISNPEVYPLTLDDLINFEANSSFDFSFRGFVSEGPAKVKGATIESTSTLTTTHANKCFALVSAGWLPPLFAMKDAILLADRNMISHISSRFQQGKLKTHADLQPDFFDFAAEYNLSAKISLAPFALEGNLRRRPSISEITSQLEEAHRKVSAALPNMEIIPINEYLVQGIMGLLEDGEEFFYKRQSFLISSIHLLGNTAGKSRRLETWKKIVSLADAVELPRSDFIVLVALFSATAHSNCNPARAILKPRPQYSSTDAYNSLCDIQILSLFIQVLHNFPDQKTVLLTKDVALVKLWSGMAPISASRRSNMTECSYKIHNRLLPIDENERLEFSKLIAIK